MSSPTTDKHERFVIAVNVGSSSIKFAVYAAIDPLSQRLRGKIDRIGFADAALMFDKTGIMGTAARVIHGYDHITAADALIKWLDLAGVLTPVHAIGHRIVHGGTRYTAPALIDEPLVEELRRISAYSPEHLPAELAVVNRFRERFSSIPQVACFDTAFHHDMPLEQISESRSRWRGSPDPASERLQDRKSYRARARHTR